MGVRRLGVVLAVLATALLAPSGAAAQPADPTAVVKVFNDALNAGDGATALAQFADDATVRTPSGSVFTGKQQIGQYAQGLIAQHYRADVDPSSVQVSGERVTSRGMVWLDDWRTLGIAPLESIADAVVRNGKIASISATLTPEAARKLQAAQASAGPTAAAPPAQAPRGLPNTGGGPALPIAAAGLAGLVALGLVALGLGGSLRRRR